MANAERRKNRPLLEKLLSVVQIMTATGKLIAVEGIDGSGKRTQVDLLNNALTARGHQTYVTGFPIYDSWFGKMVGEFLNGEFGPLEEVDPHFTALLYAGDRFEAREQMLEGLAAGKIVLADRYIGSNMAHQTARVARRRAPRFPEMDRTSRISNLRTPARKPGDLSPRPARRSAKIDRAKKRAERTLPQRTTCRKEICATWNTPQKSTTSLPSAPTGSACNVLTPPIRPCAPPESIAAEILAAVEPLLAGDSTQEKR